MSSTKPDDAAPWIRKAEVDLRVARKLDPETEPDAICFHAQQCAEKYLKALLIRHRKPFPKTHDLMLLLNMVLHLDKKIRQVEGDLGDLNPYSVIARYPGLETTPGEARHARNAARRVRALVKRMLRQAKNGGSGTGPRGRNGNTGHGKARGTRAGQ